MFAFPTWRVKRALPIIACMRSFILRYLYHHPSKLCLTPLAAPLVATALGFIVFGRVEFNGYLLVIIFDPPPVPLNQFLSMCPPLGVKFYAVRGIRVTIRHRPNGGKRSKKNG